MNNSLIDDIVKLLDQSVSKGTGHLNIEVDAQVSPGPQDTIKKSVNTLGCTDCAVGNLACNIPTLHEGADDHSETGPNELVLMKQTNNKSKNDRIQLSGGKQNE